MKNGRYAGALGVFLAAVVVTWVVFCNFTGEAAAPQLVDVELVSSSTEETSLAPGQAAQKDSAVKNTGTVPCYVRIRVDATSKGDKSVFTLGDWAGGKFRAKSFIPRNDEKEYWVQSGGYYYYRNRDTGDALVPGAETPKLFTAVAMEQEAAGGAVEIIAEAVKSGGFASSLEYWTQLQADAF